jgi:peroxin-5
MDMLLKEMQEMDRIIHQPIQAPPIKSEVSNLQNYDQNWTSASADDKLSDLWQQSVNVQQPAKADIWNFDQPSPSMSQAPFSQQYRPYQRPDYSRFLTNHQMNSQQPAVLAGQPTADDFFKEVVTDKVVQPIPIAGEEVHEDWAKSFEESKKAEEEFNEQYNKEFWNKLADEWKKLSEDSTGHPWLNELSDYYDPFKEYTYIKENPMMSVENALEKGKTFLQEGDIPSAVLCFEAAVQQESENAEAWELLGISQAENEKDPNAIVALKKALELNNLNLRVLMALAISYTNESYQNQALKMLNQWMQVNPKYTNLYNSVRGETAGIEEMATSRIRGMELENTQELFLRAVQLNAESNEFDVDVQEALGVLFNLSSEYDKAVDCFQTAVQMAPENAKLWNRLGASFANGNRPTEVMMKF